ncbi:hypothetical protein K491DRAFT_718611 [Lophiostoma macrostomum CBS 122681]|uniref:Uncharacterized protein n=1 Tax=Lophiostoma macrostomum CBS 122681 TaxID=1314788 RepID=A0A6A6T2J7_9PLEO|nr:hypothetical protein K491DRAFT_718611 [Lophiostoma macrostomum CBS 122681]
MGCLKNLVIAATNDVGYKPDQLKKWVEANSGIWVPRVGRGVKITHLVCGQSAWKAKDDAVQKAQASGAYIVTFDWLEDSLQARRKLAERTYLWEKVVHEKKKTKERKKIAKLADTNKFRKGSQKAIEDIGSGESATPSRGSSLKPGGFFASSMEALKEARLKRELKEKEKTASYASSSTKGDDNKRSAMEVDEYADKEKPAVKGDLVFKGSGEKSVSPAPPTLAPASLPTPPRSTSASKPSPDPPTSSTSTCTSQPPCPAPAVQVPEAKPAKLTDNYHLYLDATGFEYSIMLVRTNLHHNNHAMYSLRIYESNTKPHTYCTFVRYAPPKEAPAPMLMKNGIPILLPASSTTPLKSEENATPKKQPTTTNPDMPTAPPANKPYRALLTPLDADFSTAFRVFRHAFRDMTLLSWEERVYADVKNRQKAYATLCKIEPYTYRGPALGLPAGNVPAIPLQSGSIGKGSGKNALDSIMRDKDDGYIRGSLGLPGVDIGLSPGGSIGNLVHREAEAARKAKEEEEERERIKAMNQRNGGLKAKASSAAAQGSGPKKPNWNKPLFNSVSGPGVVGNAGGYGAMGFAKRDAKYDKFFYKD